MLMHFGCSDATLTGGGMVMESVGSTPICVTLDSSPESEGVNIVLETDDTPNSAQGKLFYIFSSIKILADYTSLHS